MLWLKSQNCVVGGSLKWVRNYNSTFLGCLAKDAPRCWILVDVFPFLISGELELKAFRVESRVIRCFMFPILTFVIR